MNVAVGIAMVCTGFVRRGEEVPQAGRVFCPDAEMPVGLIVVLDGQT